MKKGRVLLADFDSAKKLLNGVTEKGLKRRGTKGFVSPEVFRQISTMPLSKGDNKNMKMLSHSFFFPEDVNFWVLAIFWRAIKTYS